MSGAMSPDLRDQRVRLQDDLADVTPEDRLTQATPGPPCPSASPSQRREVDPPERGRTVSDYLVRPLGPDTWDAFGALAERHNGVWGGCWCTYFHPTSDIWPEKPRGRDWSRTG